jgi:aryl-alcohol dehydrogenase-like predicted oxidoreductase
MKLILGTANFGGQYGHGASPSLAEIERILNVAADAGIEYIDTAPAYNCDYAYNGFKVITKTPFDFGDYYALLEHDPDGDMGAATAAKTLGFVEKCGASIYTPERMMKVLHGKPDIIQLPMNIADNRFIPYLTELHKRGVEVHARSVFLRGALLTGRKLPKFTAAQCLAFVLAQDVDGVIVGVNTAEQLQELVKVKPINYQGLNICDERIIDPRRWGDA